MTKPTPPQKPEIDAAALYDRIEKQKELKEGIEAKLHPLEAEMRDALGKKGTLSENGFTQEKFVEMTELKKALGEAMAGFGKLV